MNRYTLCASALILALATTTAQAGKVYKWTDEQGVVHYTDQPPASATSVKEMDIAEPRYTPLPKSSPETGNRDADTQKEIDKVRAQQQAENAQVEKLRKERCEAARKNLDILNTTTRVRIEDNGKSRFLTPEEIVERKQRYQDIVNAECQDN
ncbi:DUF4124 domain-containing protein [Hahella sp. SMD15-11]|uniref:DUF4124 domain-containing protein n=1 Tax=Thermohahella caldifontis TaxID=3142973 RepID=A0AB39V044_9GAMM